MPNRKPQAGSRKPAPDLAGIQTFIYGAGGHGRVVLEILLSWPRPRNRIAFIDDGIKRATVDGVRVLRSLPMVDPTRHPPAHVIVAIGDNQQRWELSNIVEAGGWKLGCAIHPSAVLARTAQIAEGTMICARACVGPGAVVGAGCILNTGCDVDHDCQIGHHCHIAPGAVLCGRVVVGPGCLIGAGAILLPGCTIGSHAIVGAGALIKQGQVVPGHATMVGLPGRCIGAEDDAIAWGGKTVFG